MRSNGTTFPAARARQSRGAALGIFERCLSLWVALCIMVGIALGRLFPAPFQLFGSAEVARSTCQWPC